MAMEKQMSHSDVKIDKYKIGDMVKVRMGSTHYSYTRTIELYGIVTKIFQPESPFGDFPMRADDWRPIMIKVHLQNGTHKKVFHDQVLEVIQQ
jgi:hypothetical protein